MPELGLTEAEANERAASRHYQGRFSKGPRMSRLSLLSNPLLLGFEEIERLIDRATKGGGDGYPPYNIERIGVANGDGETLRITLAVAGFTCDDIEITVEDKQLAVRGKKDEEKDREYLYRGIAARQFARTFVLADGIEIRGADLAHGLLSIDLVRHEPERRVRRIEIGAEPGPSREAVQKIRP